MGLLFGVILVTIVIGLSALLNQPLRPLLRILVQATHLLPRNPLFATIGYRMPPLSTNQRRRLQILLLEALLRQHMRNRGLMTRLQRSPFWKTWSS